MGFRFRKSFGKGPFRVNISKSGVGYSVGTKGLRYTKKAGGGTRTTASIPGTGISYVTESGSKTSASRPAASSGVVSSSSSTASSHVFESNTSGSPNQQYCTHCYKLLEPGTTICPYCNRVQRSAAPVPVQASKKPFYKRWWFIAILAVVLLRSCGAIVGADSRDETEPTTETAQIAVEQITEAPATEEITEPTRANLEAIFADEAAALNAASSNSKSAFILNTNTGVFHDPGCRYVDEIEAGHKKKISGSRKEFINDGYDPCDHCCP